MTSKERWENFVCIRMQSILLVWLSFRTKFRDIRYGNTVAVKRGSNLMIIEEYGNKHEAVPVAGSIMIMLMVPNRHPQLPTSPPELRAPAATAAFAN